MGLLEKLNLSLPAAPAIGSPLATAVAGPAGPSGSDDAPQKADSKRGKGGQGDADAKTKVPGSDIDPRIKAVEDAINDPTKRLKALADWKIPRYAKEYDTKSPEVKFLDDFQSGLEAAKKYADYIAKATEYMQKFGDVARIDDIRTAAKGIKDITGKVMGPLGKIVHVVETGKEAVDLFQKLDKFADLTVAMDMTDIGSVQRWVTGAKSLYDAAEPFVSWAKSKAIGTAFAGSDAAAVAAQASVVIAYLAAEFYVALQILDAGVANEKAYFERYKKIMRVIENGGVPPRPDPPPPMPPAWESEDYKAYKAHERENRELREAVQNTIRAEQRAEQAKKDAAIAAEREKHKKEIEAATQARNAALRTFDETEFPKRYAKAYHLAFRDKIVAEMKKTKFSGNSPAGTWYDCLTQTQGYGVQEDEMDDQTGVFLGRIKRNLSLDEAKDEIGKFKRVEPKYPPFDAARASEWKAYAKKSGVSETPP